MSKTGRPHHCATLTFAASVLMFACYSAYPPPRPAGVPGAAVWAGGLDGGGWVICSHEASSNYNIRSLYDEEGRLHGPAKSKLKNEHRAARASERATVHVHYWSSYRA